ncbi:hypothetical protein V496_05807 [Pseudogymnoascus sp. VKM F-4515 (FW-2607)]|nr:hypothetical protein V496_05807 [Pseudogymnoascus sp. VKM F-4515 (FW-2607)]KFY96857.1 hypothetical protein V498_02450 [Pseudogymnoascus sp. VKM F-4517 (FW-2822)]
MRRVVRAERAIGRILSTPSSTQFTCAACRQHAAPFSTRASLKAVDMEKWRKKLWGTDKPPGAADPYGGPGAAEIYEAERKARKGETVVEKTSTSPAEDWDMSAYEPADNWAGLEEVGGRGVWWSGRQEPNYDGYIPQQKVTDPYELTAALHRAIVEVFALRDADQPLSKLANSDVGPDLTTEVQIVTADGGAKLSLPENVGLQDISDSLAPRVKEPVEETIVEDETAVKADPTESEADVAADRSPIDPLQQSHVQSAVESWDPAWLSISLNDPEVKFTVIKRVLQLTGIRLSDSNINASKNASDLLGFMATPPKPKKVIEALAQRHTLFDLPNVKVHARRVTPVDKEKSVGRWKVIEKELEARGLPVLGHSGN